MDALSGWYERLHQARADFDAGLIDAEALPDRARARTAAFATTPMTPDEQQAAFRLYAASAPLIASIVDRVYDPSAGPQEDALSVTYEAFLRSLSAYRPERGRVSTWLTVDLRAELRRFLRPTPQSAPLSGTDAADETDLMAAFAQIADLDRYARALVSEHPRLERLAERLFGYADDDITR